MNTTNTTTNYTADLGSLTMPTYTTTTTTNTYSIYDIFNWNEYNKIGLDSSSGSLIIKDSEAIKEIIELVPQKVYKITFQNGKSVKTILDNQDIFDPEYMLFLAYAKMLYSKTLTFSGVLKKSYQLQQEKRYIKLVKNGLKLFKKIQEDKKKKEEEEEIKKRRHKKLVAKKIAAKERKRKDKINLIAEAIRLSKEEG